MIPTDRVQKWRAMLRANGAERRLKGLRIVRASMWGFIVPVIGVGSVLGLRSLIEHGATWSISLVVSCVVSVAFIAGTVIRVLDNLTEHIAELESDHREATAILNGE